MSKLHGSYKGHHFRGDPLRFKVLAEYIAENYKGKVGRIADVAGGQGMLTRILRKKYNFDAEVVDPKGFTLVGVPSRKEEYRADMADFYDLIVGLHPDEALRAVVESAKFRPVIVLPCCNFWDRSVKLGRDALLTAIENYLSAEGISSTRVVFSFQGPKNIGLVSRR